MSEQQVFQISDILNAKIIAVRFGEDGDKEPEISDDVPPIARGVLPPTETTFELDQGEIILTLDNGLELGFWNSEWGGMAVMRKKNGR